MITAKELNNGFDSIICPCKKPISEDYLSTNLRICYDIMIGNNPEPEAEPKPEPEPVSNQN